MSFDRCLPSLSRVSRFVTRTSRDTVLITAAALLLTAQVAQAAQQTEPADVCPALSHIVAASNFKQLRSEPAAKLPGVDPLDDCHASAHAFDCRWRAHWEADGFVNDPLEEIGADIAACFPNVVHDVNTPTRQHFVVTTADGRVRVTASVQGQNELRLRITR